MADVGQRRRSEPVMKCISESTVETVVLFGKRTDDPKDYVKIGLDVEDYYKIKDIQNKQLVE